MGKIINPAIEVGWDNQYRELNFFNAPDIIVPDEKNQEKFQEWCWHNMMFGASFYNRPINYLGFGAAGDNTNAMGMQEGYELYPVQFMFRMLAYYLGKQKNLDFTFFAPLTGVGGMPPGWIAGQEVSTFLKQFQGIMRGRLANVEWTAKPVSERISEQFNIMYNMLKMNFEHKDLFADMAKNGFKFNPANGLAGKSDSMMDIDRFMAENYVEEGADVMTNIANGEWFTNDMAQMFLSAFQSCTICGTQAVEISIVNGQNKVEEVDPTYLIKDIRVPNGDDYHKKAKLIGYVKPFQPIECFNYPELTQPMVEDIKSICTSQQTNGTITPGFNFYWMNWDGRRMINSTVRSRVYWKAREFVSYKQQKSFTLDKKDKVTKDDDGDYMENIFNVDIIAGRYMVRWGETRNKVERYCKPNELEFPIQMFQPNTYLGTSVSEVGRVFKLQNELDLWRDKIIDEAAKSVGKVIIFHGDQMDKSAKQIIDELKKVGATIIVPDGEDDSPATGKQKEFEVADLGLSQNVEFYLKMCEVRKKDMQDILSISDSLLGQQASYSGAATTQNIQEANGNGMSYLIDGSLNFAVNVMRYLLGQTINLKTFKNTKNLQYCVGGKGMAFINLLNENLVDWRDIYLSLNIEDSIDKKNKDQLNTLLLGMVQNSNFNVASMKAVKNALKITNAKSYSSAIADLDKEIQIESALEAKQAKEKSASDEQEQANQIQSTERIAQMTNAMAKDKAMSIEQQKIVGNILVAFIQAGIDKNSQQADFLFSTFQQVLGQNHDAQQNALQNKHEKNMQDTAPQQPTQQ